jgi:hypothetical protein
VSGYQAKVLRSERVIEQDGSHTTFVVVDRGGGDVVTAQVMLAPGDDALPEPGDFAAVVDAPGGPVAIAFHDPGNAGTAEPGERRIYARDEDGNPVCTIWLKRDGTLAVDADVAVELTAPVVTINSPDVRISDEAGQGLARVGDLVSVIVPLMQVAAAPGPVAAVNPAQQTLTGYIAAGQIISGSTKATA